MSCTDKPKLRRVFLTSPQIWCLINQDSIGKPIPGGEWWVEDEIGVRLEPGKPGELVYQGANVMMGYAESQADLALPDQMEDLADR